MPGKNKFLKTKINAHFLLTPPHKQTIRLEFKNTHSFKRVGEMT